MGKTQNKNYLGRSKRHNPKSRPALADAIVGSVDADGDAVLGRRRKGKLRVRHEVEGEDNDDARAAKAAAKATAAAAATPGGIHIIRAQRRVDAVAEGKMTRRILTEARKQQQEEEEEGDMSSGDEDSQGNKRPRKSAAAAVSLGDDPLDVDDDRDDIEEESRFADAVARAPSGVAATDAEINLKLSKQDERELAMFLPDQAPTRRNLADIIMEKLRDQGGIDGTFSGAVGAGNVDVAGQIARTLDPKVVSVYTQIGKLLTRYTHGKLPKAFKVLPSLRDWEEVMYLTSPENWSPPAVREATRLFASNLNARMAQRFYALVLLPRVIEDYNDHKRLNFHFYYSLQKALYKPAAFFKGVLLPLCEPGACTLHLAAIVASVITRVSVPVLHASAALLKMCEMEYSGPVSVFMRTILDKAYALPYRVVDAVAMHFARFEHDSRPMPVLWHQCLLVFVQRYKGDLTEEQRDGIRNVMRVKFHMEITPEIRRELFGKGAPQARMDMD